MFCAGPNSLSQHKNLTAYSASSKSFVPTQKTILLNAKHLFVWHKKFGPAQNILGPVKGQGISTKKFCNRAVYQPTTEFYCYFFFNFTHNCKVYTKGI